MKNLAENTDLYVPRTATTGREIAAACTLLGWTQARLAEQSGVSPATVQRAERSPGIPQMQTTSLFAIIRALEQAGIQFIDANNVGDEGVRLRRRP